MSTPPSDSRDHASGSGDGPSAPLLSGTRPRLPRALVIEDSEDSRALFAAELERGGFAVSQASTGEGGLEQVRRFDPDVIILDLMLPGLNGFNLARTVRELEPTRNVAILAVSALSAEPLRRAALESGCDRFLAKPVDGPTLVKEAMLLVQGRHHGRGALG